MFVEIYVSSRLEPVLPATAGLSFRQGTAPSPACHRCVHAFPPLLGALGQRSANFFAKGQIVSLLLLQAVQSLLHLLRSAVRARKQPKQIQNKRAHLCSDKTIYKSRGGPTGHSVLAPALKFSAFHPKIYMD